MGDRLGKAKILKSIHYAKNKKPLIFQ